MGCIATACENQDVEIITLDRFVTVEDKETVIESWNVIEKDMLQFGTCVFTK